jgi:hypothetical protein
MTGTDTMYQILFGVIKPALVKWLTSRALVLPQSTIVALSKKLNVSVEAVAAIEAELIAQIPSLLDQVKL